MLELMERRPTTHSNVVGDRLTAADVEVWAAVVRHDTRRLADGHPALTAHVRRPPARPSAGTSRAAPPDGTSRPEVAVPAAPQRRTRRVPRRASPSPEGGARRGRPPAPVRGHGARVLVSRAVTST
ncbi:hypothetical protein ACGFZU_05765 [Streptomyces tendae]|uniref:hypothetical protein n=1 Tax=Streptomyces tendae TaxID=1932 RepID=UPI00371F5B96